MMTTKNDGQSEPSLILAVERSGGEPGIAIFKDNGLMHSEYFDELPARAPQWMAQLARSLAALGLAPRDFSGFVCGLGPGSFSGIRAALAAMTGMALPLNIPVYGVASAAALALGSMKRHRRELVTVVGDARRERLWCVSYRLAEDKLWLADGRVPQHTAEDFQLVSSGALPQAIAPGALVVSPDWERLHTTLSALPSAVDLIKHPCHASAAEVARLAHGGMANAITEPQPIYLHPAVAERKASA